MPTVFISHATEEDGQFAHRLAEDLRRLGVQVWIAPESIPPGEEWVEATERGLNESSHVVIVLTPAARESSWVKKETNTAVALQVEGRIQVIPLDVEPCEPPLFLSGYQMVSFYRDYETGLSQLTEILGGTRPPVVSGHKPLRPKQVFINYAGLNAQFAHRLADDLRRLGVQSWIASESIRPGEDWVSAIERGLNESSHMVIVLTPAALESKWVEMETNVAVSLEAKGRMQIIPLDVEPSEVPPLLSTYQMVSFRRNYEAGFSQLANILGVGGISPEPEMVRAPIRLPAVKKKSTIWGGLPIWGWGGITLVAALVIVIFSTIQAIKGSEPTATTPAAAMPTSMPTLLPTATPTPMNTPTPTVRSAPTPIKLRGVVLLSSWVYGSPDKNEWNRAACVMQPWQVDAVLGYTDGEGTKWYYVTWVQGDSEGSGWIEAERIGVIDIK